MASIGKGNGMRLWNLTEILRAHRNLRQISLAPCCVWRSFTAWGNWVSDLADGEWRGG